MSEITIVGGGLAGLVAANACAEAGARVTLHEAHQDLGGRARTSAHPYVAHEGPHVFYSDGPHWPWLRERRLLPPVATLSLRRDPADPDAARRRACARRHRPRSSGCSPTAAAPRPSTGTS